jgi:scyllo-inositol 2-dehydrogenase (NADP+)
VINIAVVGLGKMGLSHLAILNALSDFRVVAVCDSSAMLGTVIEKYGHIRFISNYEELIRIPNLHAVLIATPTIVHETMLRAALDRHLHVFCEKPLTLSAQASEQLAALAAEHGLVAQVGYHNRFIGTFSEISLLLKQGALGDITHVLGEAYGPVVLRPAKPTWRGKPGQGGGCLYDYAAHPLNLLNWYFGTPQKCSGAFQKKGFSLEVEDEVYATLNFADGITGQVSVNWSDPSVRKMTTRISIWGNAGKLIADRQEIQVFLTGSRPTLTGYNKGWTVRNITELTPSVSFYLRGEEYTAQLEAFGSAIIEKRNSYKNDFVSSVETDKTIEMVRTAAETGTDVGVVQMGVRVKRAGRISKRLLGI